MAKAFVPVFPVKVLGALSSASQPAIPKCRRYLRNFRSKSSHDTRDISLTASYAASEPFPSEEQESESISIDSSTTPKGATNSVAGATFSLMKAILGSGILALPAGLSAITDHPNMLWPANAILITLGALSAYTFSLYGRLAYLTGTQSLAEMWQRVQETEKSPLISIANFLYCFGCCLTFSLVIGDSISSILQASFGQMLSPWLLSRQASILAVTGTLLWPLCNLPSLAALAPVSIVGVIGSILSTLFVAFRCPALVPFSPYAVAGSGFLKGLPPTAQPLFGTYNRICSPAPLVLIAMACVAWMAHFSAPEFYHSLIDKNEKGNKQDKVALKKYNQMTIAGYSAVAILNIIMLSCGFLTFGGHCSGLILNNYATGDIGASLSRLLVAVSVIGGFPFLFNAGRSSALDLLNVTDSALPDKKVKTAKRNVTPGLFALITAVSLVVRDAGFVVSLNGALMGTSIIYIFPALLFLKQTASGLVGRSKRGLGMERWFCRFLVAFGGVSAVLGAITSVLNSYFPHLLR